MIVAFQAGRNWHWSWLPLPPEVRHAAAGAHHRPDRQGQEAGGGPISHWRILTATDEYSRSTNGHFALLACQIGTVDARCCNGAATDLVPKDQTMPRNFARYQGYGFDIFTPSEGAGHWKVHVWPPSRQPPIIMPPQASKDEAIKEAKATVDYLLHSSRQPAA
jgi:hypothetical protein